LGALVFRLGLIRKSHNGLAPMSSDQDPDSRSCVERWLTTLGWKNVLPEVLLQRPACSSSTVGFFALSSLPARCVHRRGALVKASPTWRFRVLKAALRLRPRRALSSAPGQRRQLSVSVGNRKRKNQ
jgi:hypothetical protein